MSDTDLQALWQKLRGRTYKIGNRIWVPTAIYGGPKPWVWLVQVDRPDVQSRYPAHRLEEVYS